MDIKIGSNMLDKSKSLQDRIYSFLEIYSYSNKGTTKSLCLRDLKNINEKLIQTLEGRLKPNGEYLELSKGVRIKKWGKDYIMYNQEYRMRFSDKFIPQSIKRIKDIL